MKKDIFGIQCEALEVDHIWPTSREGSNSQKNKQLLCRESNSAKADLSKGKINDIRFAIDIIEQDENKNKIGRMKIKLSNGQWKEVS